MKHNQILLGFLISATISVFAVLLFIKGIRDFTINNLLIRSGYAFLVSYLLWLTNSFFVNKIKYRFIHPTINIIIILISASITHFSVLFFTDWLFFKTVIHSMFIHIIVLLNKISFEKTKAEIELKELKHSQMEAELITLKEQLSPHFLFNTLNTLSTLTDNEEVQEFVEQLSKVYRNILQYKEKRYISVKEELDILYSYWYIIKIRFEGTVSLKIDLSERTLNTLIPPLTFQLLIENALKHNIANRKQPLAINIHEEDKHIVVENIIQLKYNNDRNTGVGLKNISKRYELIFNKNIVIQRENAIFQIKLPIINCMSI